jgi:hypothetical protein
MMHAAAQIAAVAGAVGSLGFMFHFGRHTPRFLLVIFLFWVLSPFAALFWANRQSKRWPSLVRSTLEIVTLVVALASLAIYANDTLHPRQAQAAFVYVAVAPASWLFAVIVVAIAVLVSRPR